MATSGREGVEWHPSGIPVASQWHPSGIPVASQWHPSGTELQYVAHDKVHYVHKMMIAGAGNALYALWRVIVYIIKLISSPFQWHACKNCSECAHYIDDEELFQWLKQRSHLNDYAQLVLDKKIIGIALKCKSCGCLRSQHSSLSTKLLDFDMIPNGGIVLLEDEQQRRIQNRKHRFESLHAKQRKRVSVRQMEIQELRKGDGAIISIGCEIRMRYQAFKRRNMRQFESVGTEDALQFVVGERNLIQAFERGIVGVAVGGKRRLLVPHELAFGAREIDGESFVDVIFDVEPLAIMSSD